jgi:signal transduction histidine kinase
VRSLSIATKFSLAIALLVTVSLGTLSLLAVMASRQSLREQVQSANLMVATLAARAVQQYVADAASIMQEAPGRPKLGREIRSANWPEVENVLQNFLRSFTQFNDVAVLDSAGILRVSVPHAETVGRDFSSRDFYREAKRIRGLYISGVHVSRADPQTVVSIAVPVLDEAKEVKGVIVGALSPRRMAEFVSTMGHDNRLVYVVDGKGAVIARSGGAKPTSPGTELTGLPIVQAAIGGRSGTMEFAEPEGGDSFLGAYVPIARLGWAVVAAQPVSVAYARMHRLGRSLLGIALAFTAVAVVVGWGLARTLTGPLLRLAEATQRLGRGDFAVRIRRESRDEVAAVAKSFNTMAAQLQRSYRGLEQKTREVAALNEQLELRVAERTRQLEVANRELEAFTYTVSHDLKAPLRGMDGFARALQEDYADRLDETGIRYLDRIQTSARRTGQLIDDLLRYSRLERRAPRREPVPLRPLAERVCEELKEEVHRRGLTIRFELGVEALNAEPEGLGEALANLVGNAVKFSADHAGTITIGSRQEGDRVLLWVADTGIGFDMKYHDRIFGIFERLHRQDEYPGTGVGLAIVQKVAERHGGRAWAVSESGRGSTFYLDLPVNPEGDTVTEPIERDPDTP